MSELELVLENTARGKTSFRVVGTRVPRFDAPDKVSGRAVFGPDTKLPGMLYGKFLRSPHAHARIRSIDTRRATVYPGVRAVVTGQDLRNRHTEQDQSMTDFRALQDNILANEKVLYVGHPVAAVAASSPNVAEEAAKLIEVEYEVLPAVVDVRAALKIDAPLLNEATGPIFELSNICDHYKHVKGDPSRGFAKAELIVEREFTTATVHQGYIEPNACVALWAPDGPLKVWTSTQGAFGMRSLLARSLNHPISGILVIPTEVGGGFGGKNANFLFLEPVAALLSRKANHPVKITMTRAEVFLATNPASGTYIKTKMGCTRQGHITAAQAELYYEAGAFPTERVHPGPEYLTCAAGFMFAAYDIPDAQIDAYDVLVNKPRAGAYRAPGLPQVNFAVEQVIDELVVKLDMDPIDFRLKNVAQEGKLTDFGCIYSSHGRLGGEEVLRTAKSSPHYSNPLVGPNRGRGVALAYWCNYGDTSSCIINVNGDGSVSLITGSVDLSGTRTTVAMQVAEVLGISLDRVKPNVGDTDSIGYTGSTGGSRTTFATGLAAINAARHVIAQMCQHAALLWNVEAQKVAFEQGFFINLQDSTKRMSFSELAGWLTATGSVVTGSGYANPQNWDGAYVIHIADAQVDPETGKVDILRYTVVQDVGKAVHPSCVEGQMQGGAVQGIGFGLYEGYQYNSKGEMLNPNFTDYKIPTATDVPMIETVMVEVPGSNHPFGVRGVGEAPIIPAPAALANAIYRATGTRQSALPMTPGRILESMGVI